MTMAAVQIRLTKEQIKIIQELIKRGLTPNRSEFCRNAIREYMEMERLWKK